MPSEIVLMAAYIQFCNGYLYLIIRNGIDSYIMDVIS